MSNVHSSRLLRAALAIDAAATGMLATVQILAPHAASRFLGVSVEALLATGFFLAVYAALLIWLSSSSAVSRTQIGVIIVGNVAWAIACVVCSISTPTLTAAGVGYLLLQAGAVVVFAGVQALGLRQSESFAPMSIDLSGRNHSELTL